MRVPSITVNKSSPSTLPWLQVPDLAHFLALAALAEQRGVQIPSGRTSPRAASGPPPVSRVGSEKRYPLSYQEQLPKSLYPSAPSLQHVQPCTIHVMSPSKHWGKFKRSGVQSVPPLLSEGLKRKLTGCLVSCITFPWTRQAVPGGDGLSQDSALSYFAIAGDTVLHTLGTPHQK